jgi:hypothetical protein
MAFNSSSEYKVVADKIVSPDPDIIIEITGGNAKISSAITSTAITTTPSFVA